MKPRALCVLSIATATLCFSACGGGSSGSITPPPPATYTISGTISGLTGNGLVLQDNLTDNLTVAAAATSFVFTTHIQSGAAYSVTVLTQPSDPAQNCTVTSASGVATANVTNVAVTCADDFSVGEWTWESGADIANQAGIYGTLGAPSTSNIPGARSLAASWSDADGNLWLFGGSGFDSAGTNGFLNDLWKYWAGQWTWVGGSNLANQGGTYGVVGTAAAGNIPGGRWGAASCIDPSGNLWLFGGEGYDSRAIPGLLNDLWKYSGGQWEWMSGENISNFAGTYGTLGTASPGNVPGSRSAAIAWCDSAGNFWLFGGFGSGAINSQGYLNDLWRFSSGEWTWMSGSNVIDQVSVYGTLGTPAPGNMPGSRTWPVPWIDAAGNFWLFGGFGGGTANEAGYLNDLWRYGSGEWTWMGGATTIDQQGEYGTQGQPAPGNIPGARYAPAGWIDASGNLWLFGGDGFSSSSASGDQNFNDLWVYSGGQWTWVNGSNVGNQAGIYGTLGTAAPGDFPGSRSRSASWIDVSGNLWLFGGVNTGSTSLNFNDLWQYKP